MKRRAWNGGRDGAWLCSEEGPDAAGERCAEEGEDEDEDGAVRGGPEEGEGAGAGEGRPKMSTGKRTSSMAKMLQGAAL